MRQANSGVDSRCKSGGKEGVTSHFCREPCVGSREGMGEAEGNTKPSVFVRAVRLRGVQEPMHVRTSTQGTWEASNIPRTQSPGREGKNECS